MGVCRSGVLLRLVRAHHVQEAIADAQREDVVDDVEDDEFADLAPNFGFVRGADVEQEGFEHFAGVFPGEDAFKAAANGRQRDLRNVGVFDGFQSEPEENPHLRG